MIKKFDQSNPNPSFESNINGEYNFFVNIHFRKCDYGEIYLVKYQKFINCNFYIFIINLWYLIDVKYVI